MKKILQILFLVSFTLQVNAQKKLFVRVFDMSGRLINNGFVAGVTDTSLKLWKNKDTLEIPITAFSYIKTKKSAATNLLVGALAGSLTTAGLVGLKNSEQESFSGLAPVRGTGSGALIGLGIGAAIGGITALSKNPKTFVINGNAEKWREFQTYLSKYK